MFFKKFHRRAKAKYLKLLLPRMENSGVAKASDLQGCLKSEIGVLERKYDVVLPGAYKEYLGFMGHRSGKLFNHDHLAVSYPYVLQLTQEFMDDVINEPDDDDYYSAPDDLSLPEKAFIISGRLGAWWLFIVCNGDKNPPVWSIDENDWKVERFHASVTGWLEDNCAQAEAAIKSGYYEAQPNGTTP